MQDIRVAIAGFGGIGRSAAEMMLLRRARYREVYGVDLRLVAVGNSKVGAQRKDGLELTDLDDLRDGLTGPQVLLDARPHVLIEAGPSDYETGQPACGYIGAALDRGVHVIVVSKGALVREGFQLRDRALKSGVLFKFSGACGAALPTIDLLQHGLAGCRINAIEGVLNASTNRLLELMCNGQSLEAAIETARGEGIMEGDPRKDIEGWDTAAKLLILANLGLGLRLDLSDLHVSGIQDVTPDHIASWRADGRVPKLVGRVSLEGGGPVATVAVEAVARDDLFATAHGSNKAFRVHTAEMGPITTIGCGPEPVATAAAALKDLEHILEEISR